MKQLKLALVVAGVLGVGCGQSKQAAPEAAVQHDAAPAKHPAAMPAAVTPAEVATVAAAAALPLAEVAPAPPPATASVVPASKAAAAPKASPVRQSKKEARVGKRASDDVTSF